MNLMAEESFLHDCAPKVSEQLLDHLGAWNIRFSLVTSKHLISSHHGTSAVVISAWLYNIGECSASTMSSLYRLSKESCRVPEISVKCQTLPNTSCLSCFIRNCTPKDLGAHARCEQWPLGHAQGPKGWLGNLQGTELTKAPGAASLSCPTQGRWEHPLEELVSLLSTSSRQKSHRWTTPSKRGGHSPGPERKN